MKGISGAVEAFRLTENERVQAQTAPLWVVAIVTEARSPQPRMHQVRGTAPVAEWQLTAINWRVCRRGD